MKKIRILAIVFAVLMLSVLIFVSCNKNEDEEDPCADGHTWNKTETTIAKRSCTEDGIKERTCKICKYKEQYAWKKTGHNTSKSTWEYDENATCTEDGTETRVCSICGEDPQTRPKVGSALGHDFKEYIISEDGRTETSTCDRCNLSTDTRLIGIDVNFESADKEANKLSYDAFSVYTAEGITPVDFGKLSSEDITDGEESKTNSYLTINRTDAISIGKNEYGVIFTPGYSKFKSNKFVVEFDIKISETQTKDLVLLSGKKAEGFVDFLTYDSVAKTVVASDGTVVYTLKNGDYDKWLSISLVLCDLDQRYEVYINNKLGYTNAPYENSKYFAGSDLESFKICMKNQQGVASEFSVDNIKAYLGTTPVGFEGECLDEAFSVHTTPSGNHVVYKIPSEDCEHSSYDDEHKIVVQASCTTDGYTVETCSDCGGQFVTDGDVKLAHSWQDGTRIEPTCTELGVQYKSCSCGAVDKQMIPKTDHQIDTDGSVTDMVPVVHDPTCLTDGYTEGKCKDCKTLIKYDYKERLGHKLGDNKNIVKATCTEGGSVSGKCIRCDADYTESETPALGHAYKTEFNGTASRFETTCARCNDEECATTVPYKDFGNKMPTYEEMKAAIGTNLVGAVTNFNTDFKFDETPEKDTGMRFGSSSTTANSVHRETEGSNKYLLFDRVDGVTCWYDIYDTQPQSNKDVVLDVSFKLPSEGSIASIDLQVCRRVGSHSVLFTPLKIDSSGNAKSGSMTLKKLSKDEWTKFSFVLHVEKGTYDIYVDGKIIIQNVLMKTGNAEYSETYANEYRFQGGGIGKLMMDEIYIYYSSLPVYIKEPDSVFIKTASSDFADVKHTSYENSVLYNEITFGADAFENGVLKDAYNGLVLASGKKDMKECDFLVVEKHSDGAYLTANGKKLYKITAGEKIQLAIVMNERCGTYDVYINGVISVDDGTSIVCSNAEYVNPRYSDLVYDILVSTDENIITENAAIYGGATAPVN